jgi:hypothetical protein
MQIKPIFAIAGAVAGMLLGCSGLVAAAQDEPVEQTEITPQPKPGGQEMMAEEKPAAIPIRSGRPRVERHRDARVCLDAGNNVAIIKCAEKYRYR